MDYQGNSESLLVSVAPTLNLYSLPGVSKLWPNEQQFPTIPFVYSDSFVEISLPAFFCNSRAAQLQLRSQSIKYLLSVPLQEKLANTWDTLSAKLSDHANQQVCSFICLRYSNCRNMSGKWPKMQIQILQIYQSCSQQNYSTKSKCLIIEKWLRKT